MFEILKMDKKKPCEKKDDGSAKASVKPVKVALKRLELSPNPVVAGIDDHLRFPFVIGVSLLEMFFSFLSCGPRRGRYG